jgi:hypothetical protein
MSTVPLEGITRVTSLRRGRGAWAAVFLLAALLSGCSSDPQPPVLSGGDNGSRDFLEFLAPVNSESSLVDLSLESIAALPDGSLFAAGTYRQRAAGVARLAKRTVLLVSRDGGRSWQDSGMGYLGRFFGNLCTAGESDVWMEEAEDIDEVGLVAENLMASRDGGRTWRAYPLDINRGRGLWWITSITFTDAAHGTLLVDIGHEDGKQVWKTADGGRSWQYTGLAPYPPPTDYEEERKIPASCRIPARAGDNPGTTATVRLRTDRRADDAIEAYIVERQDAAGGTWQVLSRIPVQYRVLPGNRLEPVCPRKD